MNRIYTLLIALMFCLFPFANISAEENIDSIPLNIGHSHDSLYIQQNSIILSTDTLTSDSALSESKSSDFLGRIIGKLPPWLQDYANSLLNGHVDRTFEKKVDLSFSVVPAYSKEGGFAIVGAITGLYRTNRNDSTLKPSDFIASLNASWHEAYTAYIKGNHLFSDHKSRISYAAEAYRKRLDFWGITSKETAKNPRSEYVRRQIDLQAEYIYNINSNFFAGAQIRANYTDAINVKDIEYLSDVRKQYYVTGLGLSFEFDTRDHLITPTKGIHIAYKPMIYPQFMGDAGATFHSHSILFNGYLKMWKGSVLAFDLYSKINSDYTPWTMREMIAADNIRMRGYYMGSTIDNNQIAAQIEYRQHIWSRFGLVLWGGYGTLFPDFNALKNYKELQFFPNYGIGVRFEFKNRVNIRADYGFGKGTSGLILTIGEAF